MNNYYSNELFEKVSFTSEQLSKTDFESCTFKNCDFSELHITGSEFLECEFIACNLSNTRFKGSSFKDVHCWQTKLVGVKFFEIDAFLFNMNFTGCQLNFSSFYQLSMQKFQFTECQMQEVDFTEADLQYANFDHCDLIGAIFDATNLQQANFTTAENFRIDIEKNKVQGAAFSKENVVNLLEKYKIIIS